MSASFRKYQRLYMFWHRDYANLSLTEAYIVALSIIAIMSVQSHILTIHITEKQSLASEVSYQLGQLRSQAQQIMYYANNYNEYGEEIDRNFLSRSIRGMKNNYIDLYQTVSSTKMWGAPRHPFLHTSFFSPPYDLHRQIEEFVQMADRFGTLDKEKIEQKSEALSYIKNEANGFLVTSIDNILLQYQAKELENARKHSAWQFWNVIIILFVLMLEAIFIFKPMVEATKNYQETLKRLAFEDALTGLNNRRAFIKRATALIRFLGRENKAVAVVLMDLDHFKQVNDTYGHKAGDLVLQHFSGLLTKSVRPSDVVGRVGGEEFSIVLANVRSEIAFKIIERLRRKVESTPCLIDEKHDQHLSYTASFGIIVVTSPGMDIEELMNMADKNLYKAKKNGRNTIVISTTGPEAPESDRDASGETEDGREDDDRDPREEQGEGGRPDDEVPLLEA